MELETPSSEWFADIPGQGVFVFPGEVPDDPHLLPELESYSRRFTMRRFTPSDVPALSLLLQESSVWQQGYLGTDPLPTSDDARSTMIIDRHVDAAGFAILDSSGGLIGAVTVERHHEEGWARVIHPVFMASAWNIDTGIEVHATLLDWMFGEGFERVEATVDPRNIPQADILIRGGFTDEGVRRHATRRYDGTWLDRKILSMLSGEWASSLRKSTLSGLAVRWERDLRNGGELPAAPLPEEEVEPHEAPQVPEIHEKPGTSWFGRKKKRT